MKLSRRGFFKLGGATLVAIVGGSVYRVIDHGMFGVGQGPAYAPWKGWRAAITATERIVAAGFLAANPYNSQPWLFRIAASSIDLFAVPERQIGVIDSLRREMHIGLGCAIENMKLAAQAEALNANVRLMPNSANELHVANLDLVSATPTISELYTAILNGHTDRTAYDTTRSVADVLLEKMSSLVVEKDVGLIWYKDAEARVRFGQVALAATEALIADEQQSIDSHQWWCQDWKELQHSADGVTLDAQGLGAFVTGMAKFLPDTSLQQGDAIFVQNMRAVAIPTAAAFGILVVRDGANSAQRLQGGQVWQRPHLWGTPQGLAMQPLNQMCERADREQQLGSVPVLGQAVGALVKDDYWHAIMPFRLGYPTVPTLPSPRRGLAQVIGK